MNKNYWIGAIALVVCPAVFGASFDCAKASNFVEKTICVDKQLSALDETLAVAYKKATLIASAAQAVKVRQRAWLNEERNKCQDAACLNSAYTTRLAELSNAKGKTTGKETAIVGRIEWGQLTSSVVSENGSIVTFESKSDIANQVFKACKVEDLCEVVGTVENDDILTTVSKVRKLKNAQQAVQATPQVQSQGSSNSKPSNAKSPEDEQDALLRQHWNDPLTIDYALVVPGIGGVQKKDRPASGTIRKITLGAYLNWERNASSQWKYELWNALGMQNKNAIYNRCLQEVPQQWINAFGYTETVLRSPIFVNGIVDMNKAVRIVCSPG